ncbi:ATPase [Novosphingobium album (ex Hu et al. 2023)]|uniref:ATPase n=1 Tax=Novosphingobium album (ex Hu et al. 2023) TaxID=2930093 RepID=A0ABT0AZ78_9SPHN|nr:ATPase [Novosphingobium album (ex Hu et al. 2023)]MCJ2177854.1 ATPase [Novosphingobium album (ex Hu et al. 2023)]
MAGENRIIAFGAGNGDSSNTEQTDTEAAVTPAGTEAEPRESWDEAWVADSEAGHEAAPEPPRGWIAPVLAGLAVAGWSALFAAALLPQFQAGVALADVPALAVQWCVPVLLIGLIWLLALRHSAREGKRFGDVARLLSTESALLERRLTTVNRELSLAREFIAAQSRDLEALGRVAADRLSQNAERLQDLVRDNGARVDSISTVSTAALENMEKLRGQLPVIASSAKDVTNNIANAGRTAHAQLEDMVQGFNRLNEFGSASERQVASLRTRIADTLAEFERQSEQFQTLADERFSALAAQGEQFRTQLDKREIEALAAIRTRAAALADEIDATRLQLDGHEAESLTSLRSRLTALRDESEVVSRALRDSEERAEQALRASLEALQAEQAAAADNITGIQAGTIETLKAALKTLRAEQSAAADAIASAQHGTVETLRASLEALQAEHSDTAQSISSRHRETINALKVALANMLDEQSAAAKSITAAQNTAIDSLAGRLATLVAEAERMDEALNQRGEQLVIEAEERQARQVEHERHAIARIEHMLGELDGTIAERLERHRQHAAALSERAEAVTAQLGQFESRLAEISAQTGDSEVRLTGSLQTLTDRLTAARTTLASTEGDVEKLTEDCVRMLELIQASARHTHTALPEALAISEDRLNRLESGVAALQTVLRQSAESGEELASGIEHSGAHLESLVSKLAAAQDAVKQQGENHAQQLALMQATLAEIDSATDSTAGKARDELTAAIGALRTALSEAVGAIESESATRITTVARDLGDECGLAMEKAMRTKVSEVAGQLEQAVAHAAGATRETTIQLRDQLAKIDELTGNLENRISHARQRAEEQIDNDFSRRVALITESLNSNAIDIAGALSTDVADTAWASYLRGDRGIFTRRAVNLLESADVRAIQQLFERDQTFREHVSRYIHDFEAVLRQVLSTRDGNALGVTLLSSDMGKLYVALAQGIERLRS